MKIKIFGKIVSFDEDNLGLKYFLDECCEFPTESWVLVQYASMMHLKDYEQAKKELHAASIETIKETIKYGIFDTFDYAEVRWTQTRRGKKVCRACS